MVTAFQDDRRHPSSNVDSDPRSANFKLGTACRKKIIIGWSKQSSPLLVFWWEWSWYCYLRVSGDIAGWFTMKTRWSSAKRETWCIFVRREPRPIGRTDTLCGVLKGLFKVFVFNLTRDYDLDLPIFWARGAARYRWRCRYFGTRASIRCGSKSWENDWGGLQSSSNDVPMWTNGVRPRGWTLYHALPFFFGSMVFFSCFYSSDQWERGHSARKLDPEVPMIGFGGLWMVVENLFRHFFLHQF